VSWRDRLPDVRGRLLRDEPLAPFTWLRVGGPADVLFLPADEADLSGFLAALDPATPVTPLGVGSNTLVRDGGVEGVVIRLAGRAFSRIERVGDRRLLAGAAALDAHLAREAAAAGLAGLEWAVGIPGTVGGAAVMNAGAQGGCTADCLASVMVLDPARPEREPFEIAARDLAFDYRHSRLQQEALVVVSARFRLEPGHDPAAVSGRTSANLHSRTSTQPYQQPSCGSVFRNPEPRKAGRLIEELGLKGLRIGGAEVSAIHANFIVNTGAASADDIDRLIRAVQDRVAASHAIALHPEVKRLGFDSTGAST